MDHNNEHKNSKIIKKCIIKRKFMFENYTDCLLNKKIKLKSKQRFKSNYQNFHTQQINKTELSSNDDKTSQKFDKITTYPYRTNALKACECKMLSKYK